MRWCPTLRRSSSTELINFMESTSLRRRRLPTLLSLNSLMCVQHFRFPFSAPSSLTCPPTNQETERLPESRKLELNGYLTKPTTRLARYPLLLEACLKNTPEDNPDKVMLPKVVKLVREFLNSVNIETGKSENRFNLAQLDQQLVFKNGEAVVRLGSYFPLSF